MFNQKKGIAAATVATIKISSSAFCCMFCIPQFALLVHMWTKAKSKIYIYIGR